MAYMRLGDLLVSSGIITGEQLEQALALPREDGQRLGDVLIRQGVISEAQLIDALRVQLGVDFVDLTAVSIPVELAKYVPRNLAKKFLVVPVKLVQDRLYLAMHDPLDFVAQDEVKTASRKRIIPMIATRKAVEQAIERLYGSEGTARVIEEMKREAGAGEDIIPAQMARDTADPEASAPTIRFVNSLIERAFTERASDIHLEPQEGEMLVRMRIDGLLQRVLTVPADLQNTVISRLKIMGGMNIAEHKVPQDGHAMFSVRGHSLDLRIASMPTVYGEKIVLRLLDKSAQVLDKSVLGLEGRDLDNYNALLKNTSGVVLLACAFADLEGYIIPDRFIAVGVVLFIVTLFFVPDPGKRALDGLIGGVAVGGGVLLLALLMEKLLRRDAMGGGDIKLLFLTGLFLGWQKNLLCLLLACVVGILWGLVRAKRGQQGLPWGPGIALAAWCAALFGQNLIDWYLSLL